MKNYTLMLWIICGLFCSLGLLAACDEPDGTIGHQPDPAVVDYYLEFDGDGDFVSVAHHEVLDLGAAWTLECWAVLGDNASPRPLIRKGDGKVDTASFYVYGNSIDDLATAGYRINQLNAVHQVASDMTLGAEIWHHLALVNDGQRLTLYVDGEAEGSSPTGGEALVPDDSDLILGANLRQSSFHLGKLDEVRISTVARYGEDFEPALRFEVDEHTAALWHFDEGQGAEVLDEARGLSGEIHGDVSFVER